MTKVRALRNMTFARLVDLKFKPGKREEGMRTIADFSKDAREGFEGMLILFPTDDPDKVTYVTLWNSEEAMTGSWDRINPRVTERLRDIVIEEPSMRSTEVHEIQKLTILTS